MSHPLYDSNSFNEIRFYYERERLIYKHMENGQTESHNRILTDDFVRKSEVRCIYIIPLPVRAGVTPHEGLLPRHGLGEGVHVAMCALGGNAVTRYGP